MKEHFFHLTMLEQILLVNTAVMLIIWTIAYFGYINSINYSQKQSFYRTQKIILPTAIIFFSIFVFVFIHTHYIKPYIKQQKQNEIQLNFQQKIEQQIKDINKKLFKSKNLSKKQILELEKNRADLYQKLIVQKISSFKTKIDKMDYIIDEIKNNIINLEQRNAINKKEMLQIKRNKNFINQKIKELEKQLNKIRKNQKSIQTLLQTSKKIKNVKNFTQNTNANNVKTNAISKEEFEIIVHGLNHNINKVNSILEINRQIENINKEN